MKVIYLLIGLLIFYLSKDVIAQTDTTYLSYYPLHKGDYWQYQNIIFDWTVPPPSAYYSYYSISVIGDSVLPNGKSYKILKSTQLDSILSTFIYFERIDTLTANVYRYDDYLGIEYLIDSLKSQLGDSSYASRSGYQINNQATYCTDINTDTVLTVATVSKEFNHWYGTFQVTYTLASGFGLTWYFTPVGFGTISDQLLYAIIDGVEYGTPVDFIEKQKSQKIESFYLYQNYPNPFNAQTTIKFYLPQTSYIELSVYSVTGELVKKIFSGRLAAGSHQYFWDASTYASGIYLYHISTSFGVVKMKKMIYLK